MINCLSDMVCTVHSPSRDVPCPEYLIGQKFGGHYCRKFGLMPKILSAEKFCPPNFLSAEMFCLLLSLWLRPYLDILENIIKTRITRKHSFIFRRTKLPKFRVGAENFVRRNILSAEFFVRRIFVR